MSREEKSYDLVRIDGRQAPFSVEGRMIVACYRGLMYAMSKEASKGTVVAINRKKTI